MLDDLARWRDEIAALPEPISYIVLDHDVPPNSVVKRRDAKGSLCLIASPSILDAATHRKVAGIDLLGCDAIPPGLGLPVYKREDMPEGWPDA